MWLSDIEQLDYEFEIAITHKNRERIIQLFYLL